MSRTSSPDALVARRKEVVDPIGASPTGGAHGLTSARGRGGESYCLLFDSVRRIGKTAAGDREAAAAAAVVAAEARAVPTTITKPRGQEYTYSYII